jgi:hypothetical protein
VRAIVLEREAGATWIGALPQAAHD